MDFIVSETQPSDLLRDSFDTVLIRGVCSGAKEQFEISRKPVNGFWSQWLKPDRESWGAHSGDFWIRFTFLKAMRGSVRLRRKYKATPCVMELRSVQAFMNVPERSFRTQIEPPEVVPQPPALPPDLHVMSREEWGAAPYRDAPIYQERLQWITQHHTAGACPKDIEDAKKEMRFLQDFHQNGRGWDDIGYHFVIDCAGRIFQGRPLNIQGAHVLSHNAENAGISFMGSYHPPYNDSVSEAQLQSLVSLGSWLVVAYGITVEHYDGHRDYNAGTSCPGDNLYGMLLQIRKLFETRPPEVVPSTVVGAPASVGLHIQDRLAPMLRVMSTFPEVPRE